MSLKLRQLVSQRRGGRHRGGLVWCDHCGERHPKASCPSLAEIAERCDEIQQCWTPHEEIKRRGGVPFYQQQYPVTAKSEVVRYDDRVYTTPDETFANTNTDKDQDQ